MPQQASTALRSADAVPTAPRPARVSLEGIGDVVDAGRRSGYAHLGERRLPTIGRLVSAARGAAEAMRRPTLWPARRGRWQIAPRAARRRASGRLRVTTVALEPNTFVPEPTAHPGRRHSLEVLYLVSGRAHLIASGPGGEMLSAAELTPGRARVVGVAHQGAGDRRASQHLVNTGDEVAVVVRVTA
ncbi:hypothetical protein ACIBFB_26165 [Nocardiopsis sp. NPDC050513]|uniref:hypothetical protein n=1 Tax=Nocardiopsis sp. NPDC050513 TaxID=3364338 RepID=UPI00379D63A0